MVRAPRWWCLVAVLALAGTACFAPKQPACAFSCATDGTCPASYVCGSDNLCHRGDEAGVCLLDPVDAGADAPDTADAPRE